MPKGYWIGRIDVHDPEGYRRYIEAATPAYAEFGARFLVRSGRIEAVEGAARSRNVVIEFPSYDAALACFHSETYQKASTIRRAFSDGELIVVEGYGG